MANILIIGGGFGGLVTAERLAASIDTSHQITLVAPSEKFTFYPALVQLAFGEIGPDDMTFNLRARLDEIDVRFVKGELIRINADRRAAQVAGDDFTGEIKYDYIVLAAGRRLATEKIGGFFEHAHHLLGTGAALKFGEAVRAFSEGTILVGMCPGARLPVPVCETAFALANRFEKQIDEGRVHIKVIFPESLEAAFGGAALHKELEAAFERRRINVLYDVPVREITDEAVLSAKGHEVKYDLLMLLPPFRGQAIFGRMGITDADDFVRTDGLMRVHDLENAYAVGDVVALSGPKFAHMAVRQADTAAENILSELNGEKPAREYYHEIRTIIDAGGRDSIYLHYGVWDDMLFNVKKGRFWSWAKSLHSEFWRAKHKA
jgi:sulfide:quinone oxidoreductase